jgi:hypothetical protein
MWANQGTVPIIGKRSIKGDRPPYKDNEMLKALATTGRKCGRGEKNPVGEGHVRLLIRMIKD